MPFVPRSGEGITMTLCLDDKWNLKRGLKPGLALLLALLAVGCSNTGDSSGSSGTFVVHLLIADPSAPEVGQQIRISGSASGIEDASSSASWVAVRDGSVSVSSGTLTLPADGAPVSFSFTDTIATPGAHRYVVTLASAQGASREETLDLPVVYNVAPSIHADADSILTLTLTNNGVGSVAFAIPYSVSTSGLASGVIQIFDFSGTPLAPGASRSTALDLTPPVSGTYTFTVDPEATLGTNLAGSPADVALPFGSG